MAEREQKQKQSLSESVTRPVVRELDACVDLVRLTWITLGFEIGRVGRGQGQVSHRILFSCIEKVVEKLKDNEATGGRACDREEIEEIAMPPCLAVVLFTPPSTVIIGSSTLSTHRGR